MTYKDDGLVRKKCKLELNNAPKIRHFWKGKQQQCDCGCKDRWYIKSPICFEELKELLNKKGYSLEKVNNIGSAEGVDDEVRIKKKRK